MQVICQAATTVTVYLNVDEQISTFQKIWDAKSSRLSARDATREKPRSTILKLIAVEKYPDKNAKNVTAQVVLVPALGIV